MRLSAGLLSLCLVTVAGHGAVVSPIATEDMTKIRLAAESGDPNSQDTLGEAYFHRFEYATAAQWFGKAATAGVANSQWRLGGMLLTGKTSIKKGLAVERDPQRGLRWLFAAASQGHQIAQLDLARVYEKGLVGPTNRVEAYKWLARAAQQGSLVGRTQLNSLVLSMSIEELAEGRRRVRMPPERCAICRNLMGSQAGQELELRLQGITGFPSKPLALISGKTFAEGEESTIKVDGREVTIRCVEIQARSVVVISNGVRSTLEL